MAGYSGTPLRKKIGIKEDHRVLLIGAPRGFGKTLGQTPGGREGSSNPQRAPVDVVVGFAKTPQRRGRPFRVARSITSIGRA